MVNQLRHEACSGQIEDLAHVTTAECLSDGLTKRDAKTDVLTKTVNEGRLFSVDKHPPFREIMRGKHKAYAFTPELVCWLMTHVKEASQVTSFLMVPLAKYMRYAYSLTSLAI